MVFFAEVTASEVQRTAKLSIGMRILQGLRCVFSVRSVSKQQKILFRGGKKSVEINGVQKNSAAALIERFCAVVFSPEHLSLIKRGPGERRKFIDSAICREKLKNAVVLSKYNRILNQRNSLLKDIYRRPSLADTLPVWDEPLLKSGAVLVKNRIDYVKMLSDRAVEYHNGISKGKEELKIRYMSGYEASENDTVGEIYEKLKCKLEKHKSDDIRTGFTNYGPHRDDIEIIINGKNARAFCISGTTAKCGSVAEACRGVCIA